LSKPNGKDTFGHVKDEKLLEEIMLEVENLNQSIKELFPETISASQIPSIQDHDDELKRLAEHRKNVLSENSKTRFGSKKSQ